MRKRSKYRRITALRTLALLKEAPSGLTNVQPWAWRDIRDALIEHLQALIVAGRK
jgi:hypothetical protein